MGEEAGKEIICKNCKREVKAIRVDKNGRFRHAGEGGCNRFVPTKLKDNPAITVITAREEDPKEPKQEANSASSQAPQVAREGEEKAKVKAESEEEKAEEVAVETEETTVPKQKSEEVTVEAEEIAAPEEKRAVVPKEAEDVSSVRDEFEQLLEGKEGLAGVSIEEVSAGKSGLIVELKEKTPAVVLTIPKIFKGYPVRIEESTEAPSPSSKETTHEEPKPIATTATTATTRTRGRERGREEGGIRAKKETAEETAEESGRDLAPVRVSKAVRRFTNRKWGVFFEGPIRRVTREWLAEKVPRRVAIASSGVTLQDKVVASIEEAKAFILYDPRKVPDKVSKLTNENFIVIEKPGKDIFSVLDGYSVEAIIVNSEKYKDNTAFRVIEGDVKEVIEKSKEK